jgi:hypothetical protein
MNPDEIMAAVERRYGMVGVYAVEYYFELVEEEEALWK